MTRKYPRNRQGEDTGLNSTGRIAILGFGSIGSGLLPLLTRHVDPRRITIIGADHRNVSLAAKYGVAHMVEPLDQHNYQTVLGRAVSTGDFLVNLSVNVSSLELIRWCHQENVMYLDTCIEPWEGYYTDTAIPPERRSNYALRQEVLDQRQAWRRTGAGAGPTAIIAHGANPGLVSHLVKRALLQVAERYAPHMATTPPEDRADWTALAQALGLRVIHIAERDTQTPRTPKQPGEFVNTWSVDGFVSEGLQPSELGWGSHERHWPADGNRFSWGCRSAIWLNRPGCTTQVRSWTPAEGPYQGWLITHNESISIADYFSNLDYSPTVHYAYHPCDSAVLSIHELAGKNFQQQATQRLIVDEVDSGVDELGVLLMGTVDGQHWCYWHGSHLDIHTARALAPHNNATSLQVVAPVLAGILWGLDHPNRGIVEADELPHDWILEQVDPYLGRIVGEWTNWTPLVDRGILFPEDVDATDPWQFKNFRVV